MKRFFFTAIALAAVAVSCTKSGLLESPETYVPISFEPYAGKAPVTKATAIETPGLEKSGFRVIGFEGTDATAVDAVKGTPYLRKVVDNVDGNAEWEYTGAMYWQANQNLSFIAYGLNVNAETDETPTAKGTDGDIAAEGANFKQKATTDYTVFTYTVPDEVANQKDLIISPFIPNKNSTSGTIEVKLHHVLSRIGFQLQIDGTEGINVIVKNLTLKGTGFKTADYDLTKAVTYTPADAEAGTSAKLDCANTPGTAATLAYSLFDSDYTYDEQNAGLNTGTSYPGFMVKSAAAGSTTPICRNATTTFPPETEEVKYDPNGKTVSAPTDTELKNRYMMILPQTLTNGSVEVIYQMAGGEEQKVDLPLTTEFEAGKAYEFIFTVSTTAVKFGVIVEPWGENIDKPYPLN